MGYSFGHNIFIGHKSEDFSPHHVPALEVEGEVGHPGKVVVKYDGTKVVMYLRADHTNGDGVPVTVTDGEELQGSYLTALFQDEGRYERWCHHFGLCPEAAIDGRTESLRDDGYISACEEFVGRPDVLEGLGRALQLAMVEAVAEECPSAEARFRHYGWVSSRFQPIAELLAEVKEAARPFWEVDGDTLRSEQFEGLLDPALTHFVGSCERAVGGPYWEAISENVFSQQMEEVLFDAYGLDQLPGFIMQHIDLHEVVRDMKGDYEVVGFNGLTYYVRVA